MPRVLKWILGVGTVVALALAAVTLLKTTGCPIGYNERCPIELQSLIAFLILFAWGFIAGVILLLWILVRAVLWLLGDRVPPSDPGGLEDLDDSGHSPETEGAENLDNWENMRDLDDLPG